MFIANLDDVTSFNTSKFCCVFKITQCVMNSRGNTILEILEIVQ